jgi:hypothetical protein
MTEAQWLVGDDPFAMVEWLWQQGGPPTPIENRFTVRLSRLAAACLGKPYEFEYSPQFNGVGTYPDGWQFLWMQQVEDHDSQWAEEWDAAASLPFIRCLFGNPFRTVAFSPAWRTDTTVSLARHMYDARDFTAMPILADALQDAGCDNEDILDHCCGSGPHVRGCWVVDLVLGKE